MSLRKSMVIAAATALTACGGGGGNEAPVFSQSSYTFELLEDNPFSGQVNATDSDAISYTVGSAANNGVFSLNGDGSFTYTPNADYNGEDSVTVQASDGRLTTSATIRFVIENINDEPVLVTNQIALTTGAETTGQIQVTDADAEDIIYTLVSQPSNGNIQLNANTGAFTYTTQELNEINDSFVISYTDGVIASPIEAELYLVPAYVTNADKLNYYYASSESHLKRAETIRDGVSDDNLLNDINADLALAYSTAGFASQADALFDVITTLDDQSDAYRDAATAQQLLGNTEKAAQFRQQSELLYTQFVAEKGINNMSSSDFGVFLEIVRDYQEVGELDAASALLANVKVFASAFLAEEYNTSYGYALTAFDQHADELSELYFADRSDENYQSALDAANEFAELAKQTGYYVERSNGLPSERQRVLRTTWAAEKLFNISALEEAKDLTNFALSMYGITGIDANYPYQASPYAQNTLERYPFSLASLAGLVGALYPELETNPALALLTFSFDIEDAQKSILSKQIANDIASGVDIETAIAPAFEFFLATDNYLELYEALVENFVFEPGAARLLYTMGETESAIALLQRAVELLTSEEYIDGILADRFGQMSNISGRKGCLKATQLMQTFGGDASAIATLCATMVENYLNTEAGKVTTDFAIQAHRNLMQTQDAVSDVEAVAATAPKLVSEIALLSSSTDKAEQQFLAANYMLRYGVPERAMPELFAGLDTLKQAVDADETGEILADAIDLLEEYVYRNGFAVTGAHEQESFLRGLKMYPGKLANYAEYRASIYARVDTEAAFYTNALLARSANEISSDIDKLIVINHAIDHRTAVANLLANDSLGEADIIILQADYAQLIAVEDDFVATSIASVDTDHDGLPNFFIGSASPDDIAASGLVADDDADNDGIADAQDSDPLN